MMLMLLSPDECNGRLRLLEMEGERRRTRRGHEGNLQGEIQRARMEVVVMVDVGGGWGGCGWWWRLGEGV